MTGQIAIEDVEPGDWRSAVGAAIQAGGQFDCLYAVPAGHDPVVRLVMRDGVGVRVLSTVAVASRTDSIVDLLPAAEWDEREAHDVHRVHFDGHEPMRALVGHPADRDAWITPVEGPDVHEVAVGPIHAGVIESGHFRFHVVGERILHLDLRLFYKHRDLEGVAAGLDLARGVAVAQRSCAPCAVANSLACATAIESLMGLEPDEDLRRGRTILLELERLYNHLHDLSALCSGVGFDPGAMTFAALKERAQRLNLRVAGHRFLFDTIRTGGGTTVLDQATAHEAGGELASIVREAGEAWRTLTFMESVQDRLGGIGILDRDQALHRGAVGPTARASGIRTDARAGSPAGLWYPGLEPARPDRPAGDVAARAGVRAVEIEQTGAILGELLARPPCGPGLAVAGRRQAAVGVGRTESPRGATVCCVEAAGGRIARLHLRTASFANWPAVADVVAGAIMPDFPLINKSFELCYACVDR